MPGKRVATASLIRVGPAGWSYKDWETKVFPKKPGPHFDPLEYLGHYFDTIEINSSFYRSPAVTTAQAWAKRVSNFPDFLFTAKLNRIFTHERGKATLEDDKAFREGMNPLAKAGKLGAVLVQFPWSFKNTDEDRVYLKTLLKKFADYPLVLEVRHSSWNIPEVYEWLEEMRVGVCNIDQPLFSKSIKPNALTTSTIGYVRLHGRNYQNWFRDKAPRDERYNYLYSTKELEPWITRIKDVASRTRASYVITNNHFQGQAVVNALEIKASLAEQKVPAPSPLIKTYTRLGESAFAFEPESKTKSELFS